MSAIRALATTDGSGAPALPNLPPPHPDAAIYSELRALGACEAIRAEWTDLADRALEPNPCLEPGFALAAAQHLVSFRDAEVMLLWQGDPASERRRLVGLVPCRTRRHLLASDTLEGFADPRLLNGTPLLDRTFAVPALAAFLRDWRGRSHAAGAFSLSGIDPAGAFATTLARVADGHGVVVGWQPLIGRRLELPPTARIASSDETLRDKGRLVLAEATNQADRRDAVEILLAIEASGSRGRAGKATLQDTREVGFLRSMSRDLGRQKLCRVAVLVLDDRPIAAALTIGKGASCWLYHGVGDEAHAALEPLPMLLAMMRKAAPSRQILLPGGLPLFGARDEAFGTITLTRRPQQPMRRPADLAIRMHERLARALFRPRPAAIDG
ncbi:GNAT family N-acetyltransferase [Bosea sp. UC22_33]|uniref:GNAT family N-acetyltransferase n=1 Tax=Bosea sp. UC22_33 TaxID=3350165 RepID=UPI00366B2120